MINDNLPKKYDLEERTAKFGEDIIDFAKKIPKNTITFPLISQLIRAGTSVGANYVEAQAASSKKDFVNFLFHSLKSANESKFWLAILRDSGKADKNQVNALLSELTEISNILGSSIITVRGRK